MIDADRLTSALLERTEDNDLIWGYTDHRDAFQIERAGLACIVWFDQEVETIVLTMRDEEYCTREYGTEVEALYEAILRQMFYRSKAPKRLLASLDRSAPPVRARH